MNGHINFEILSASLQDSLIKALKDKSVDELKVLDWLSWETDFFIEQNKALFSNTA
ncbi:hypothetical protein MNBD_GAMMA10-3051 [hydrothermal vent metagenome]|uniref:Uncharacterized protein n=1 Tax=hydrothermal vent metagenome TaxID=652676 RepID=A0A3B0XX77_9ZZZZ